MRCAVQRRALRLILLSMLVLAAGAWAEPAADSGTVPSGKFNLNYRIEGAGAPALVIGFPNYYARVFSENLRSHLRLVFVDHRGTAASPGSVDTSEFALERIVDDVELVRETLRLGRIAVIGHSGHAYMALEYAKKYPENVSHVIMIGIDPGGGRRSEATQENWLKLASPERKSALEENQARITDEQLAQLPPDERWIRRYIRRGPQIFYDPHFDSTPLWDGVDINMEMLNYVWGELFRDIDITVGLEKFDRPVFVALGRYDFLVAPPSSWDQVKNDFNDLTVRVFEKSGHTPQYEEPELFDRELLAWMQEKE